MDIVLKVRIKMTPAQVQDYCDEYGIDRAEFRKNVSSYVENMVQTSAGLNTEDGRAESVSVA